MRKRNRSILFLTAILCLINGSAFAEEQHSDEVLTWTRLSSKSDFQLLPMTQQRIGFTLDAKDQGRRVVVAVSARLESDGATGYSDPLAININGEVMGLTIAGKSRLINRPMSFQFGPNAKRKQVSGRAGTLGLIENQGSARWMLPAASSFDTWLNSKSYKPTGLNDPKWIILDITDLIFPNSFNYVTLRNETKNVTIRCEKVSVHYAPSQDELIQKAHHALQEKYFDRAAVVRESTTGREWSYGMDLIANSHGAEGSMSELQSIEDARKVIAPLKRDGYNAVIVSGLHMRYSYTRHWETRIAPYMKYICQAAHEAGMKVIDLYDVPMYFAGGYPFLFENDHLQWVQQDIRFNTPTRMYCINNPDFRNHFFTFTRRIQRESGIDGYQIDEVTFFDKNFCGCEHCRSQFKEETGFELPREADSPVFFNNGDPLWRLFLLWRSTSAMRFKKDFIASIHQEYPAAILSNYTTSHGSPSRRGSSWGKFMISYTNGKEGVTRLPMLDYSYGLADYKIYTGLADALGHSTWMLWYPLTGSAARFSWALSQASGCGQWHSRKWSSTVKDLIVWPHKSIKYDFTTFADIGVIFSEKSKDASLWTGYYHGMETLGWGEAMIENNIQFHSVHEISVTPEVLNRYKVIFLPQMTVIDDENQAAIESFVNNGGTLIVTGETGMIDQQQHPRSDFLLSDMMNLNFVDMINAPFEVVEGKFTYAADRMFYHYGARMLHVKIRDPARSKVLVHFKKDGKNYPGIIESKYGKGKVYTITTFFGVSNLKYANHGNRKDIFRTNPDSAPFMSHWLRKILGENETVVATDLPPKMVYTIWINKEKRDEINVHFLNVTDHKPLGPNEIGKRRRINFPLVENKMTLLLRIKGATDAIFYSPDSPDPVKCQLKKTSQGTHVTVPGGKMKMYGLLKIQGVTQ